MDIPRRRLKAGMLRQMDIQNAMYPDSVPTLDVRRGGMDPLEFAKLVECSFPAILNHAVVDFPALKWDTNYFRKKIGSLQCQVAETPHGDADSPRGALFVKPHIRRMAVSEFLDTLESKDQDDGVVRYMQSQDGNLTSEFAPLVGDAPDIAWASQVIGQPAEAVNLWIGDNRTTSRLHNDNYENLFIQITGQKTFYLIPPSNTYALDERFLVDATYVKKKDDNFVIQVDDTEIEIPQDSSESEISRLLKKSPKRKILFPTVDPANQATHNQIYKQHCKVYKVALNAGQMLYIPALWYHQVSITDPAVSISLNYWYPASTIKPAWALWDYLRVTSTLLHGYHDPDFFEDDDDDDQEEE